MSDPDRLSQLHAAAMRQADLALAADRMGSTSASRQLYRMAMLSEKQAAAAAGDHEPARSVLYRSAGSLALLCGDVDEAARLALLGLAGDPPPEIAGELEGIEERVNRDAVQRSLERRG